MDEQRPLRPLAAIALLAAAAWIAAGAGYKWLGGSPNDLPTVLRVDWLDIGLVYRFAIGIELVVVALVLLAPRVGWVFVVLQFIAFLGVLTVQVSSGAASCGCFGSTIKIAPQTMMLIDGALLAAVIATRPWSANLWRVRPPVVAIVALLGLAAPWLYTREVSSVQNGNGNTPTPARNGFVLIDERTWPGQEVSQLEFVPFLDTPVENLMPGTWVFYRKSCPHCADHLRAMRGADQGNEPITLICIPEPDLDPNAIVVELVPTGPHVTEVSLRAGLDYTLTTPTDMRVEWSYLVSRVRGSEELDIEGTPPFPTADPAILEAAEAARKR